MGPWSKTAPFALKFEAESLVPWSKAASLTPTARFFSVSSPLSARHWWDMLEDDKLKQPPHRKGATNPKPFEVELDLKAYRLEQEEKYRGLRKMLVIYVVVGTVCGYIAAEYYFQYEKMRRNMRWMTPEAGDKLRPVIWSMGIALAFVVVEFAETMGTLGAHLPIYTLGSFLAVVAAKKLYQFVRIMLFD